MNIFAILIVFFFFGIGIVFGWVINDHITTKRQEKAEQGRYEKFMNVREKIRGKFFDEIVINLERISADMKESAVTRSTKSVKFVQRCFRKNIFKLRDKPLRRLIRNFYVRLNTYTSSLKHLNDFYDMFVKDNPDLSSEQRNEIQMSLINLKLSKLENLNKLGQEIKEMLKKLELPEVKKKEGES